MKTTRFAWLAAGLLATSGVALAQPTSSIARSRLPAGGSAVLPAPAPEAAASDLRPVLGAPPQVAPGAPEPPESADLALLRQLPLATAGQPTRQLLLAELARVFPRGVRQRAGFRPDVAAWPRRRRWPAAARSWRSPSASA